MTTIDCPQHAPGAAMTMRQMHHTDECPATAACRAQLGGA